MVEEKWLKSYVSLKCSIPFYREKNEDKIRLQKLNPTVEMMIVSIKWLKCASLDFLSLIFGKSEDKILEKSEDKVQSF